MSPLSQPSDLVVNLAREQKRVSNIISSLDLTISAEGDFADATGRLNLNALRCKVLNRYRAEGGAFVGKAASSLVDRVLKRFHTALLRAIEVKHADHDARR